MKSELLTRPCTSHPRPPCPPLWSSPVTLLTAAPHSVLSTLARLMFPDCTTCTPTPGPLHVLLSASPAHCQLGLLCVTSLQGRVSGPCAFRHSPPPQPRKILSRTWLRPPPAYPTFRTSDASGYRPPFHSRLGGVPVPLGVTVHPWPEPHLPFTFLSSPGRGATKAAESHSRITWSSPIPLLRFQLQTP